MAGPAEGASEQRGTYAFGDTAVASRRLDVLASVFGPTSAALLADLPARRCRTVLDLGCGPGHTTTMLADAFPEAEVTGIDASAAFVAEATASAPARCRYRLADVTEEPLPGGTGRPDLRPLPRRPPPRPLRGHGRLGPPADPRRGPGGGGTGTDRDRGRRFPPLPGAGLAGGGGPGRRPLRRPPPVRACRRSDTALTWARSTALDVPAGRAATIFSLNLATWRDDPAVTAVAAPAETAALADRLEPAPGRPDHRGHPLVDGPTRRRWLAESGRAVSHRILWRTVVLDFPADVHDRARDFWQAALDGGIRRGTHHPAYHVLEHPAALGTVLVQQIEEGASRIHLDIESDDTEAEVDPPAGRRRRRGGPDRGLGRPPRSGGPALLRHPGPARRGLRALGPPGGGLTGPGRRDRPQEKAGATRTTWT